MQSAFRRSCGRRIAGLLCWPPKPPANNQARLLLQAAHHQGHGDHGDSGPGDEASLAGNLSNLSASIGSHGAGSGRRALSEGPVREHKNGVILQVAASSQGCKIYYYIQHNACLRGTSRARPTHLMVRDTVGRTAERRTAERADAQETDALPARANAIVLWVGGWKGSRRDRLGGGGAERAVQQANKQQQVAQALPALLDNNGGVRV